MISPRRRFGRVKTITQLSGYPDNQVLPLFCQENEGPIVKKVSHKVADNFIDPFPSPWSIRCLWPPQRPRRFRHLWPTPGIRHPLNFRSTDRLSHQHAEYLLQMMSQQGNMPLVRVKMGLAMWQFCGGITRHRHRHIPVRLPVPLMHLHVDFFQLESPRPRC